MQDLWQEVLSQDVRADYPNGVAFEQLVHKARHTVWTQLVDALLGDCSELITAQSPKAGDAVDGNIFLHDYFN